MPSASEDRFRQSWKLEELSGKPAQAWLIVRRTVATLLAIGLLIFCGWLILRLFRVPTSYLAYWSASAYEPLRAGPVKYACDDYAAIESLKGSFVETSLVNPAEDRLTKETLEKNLRALSNLGMRSKDACIVLVTAHGIVRDNKPYLLCELSGPESEIAVSEVLKLLKEVPAGTKLLILDAGRNELATEDSADDDMFPALFDTEVKENNDPTLWVLTANAALERSHVSAELSRSVFGYMVSKGLRGEADLDRNGQIQLDELYKYVQSAVSARVNTATAGGDAQMPQLLYCDAEAQSLDKVATHRLIDTPKQPPEPVPVKHVAKAETEHKSGRIRDVLSQWGQQVKQQLSIKDELHVASEILGIHSEGEHGEHGDEGATHDSHASGAPGKHGDTEHKNAAHDAKPETKVELAEAATKQASIVWQRAAQLESSTDRTSPGVVFPPVWRELLERILWCDQFCASGVPADAKDSWNQVANELDGIDESLKELAAYRAPTNLDPARMKGLADQGISFAVADRMAVIVPEMRLSKPLTDFISKYDLLLLSEPPATFKDKLNAALLAVQKTDLGLEKYYEFQLLEINKESQTLALNKDPEVSSATLQLVLRARRIGESVAANPLCGEGWSRKTIAAADRLRSDGERELLDRTSSNWENQASERLKEAVSGYNLAFRDLEVVRSAFQDRNAALLRAPDLIHLVCLDGGGNEDVVAVQKIFSSLRSLNAKLADPAKTSVDDLKGLLKQLNDTNDELERKADTENNAWRMSNLLATTIPSPKLREKLRGKLAATEHAQMASGKGPESDSEAVTTSTINDKQWQRVKDEFNLHVGLAELAGYEEAAKLRESLDSEESDRIKKLDKARKDLANLMLEAPADINGKTKEGGEATPVPIDQLRKVLPQWLLLGPRQLDLLDKSNLIASLDRASWHDLLKWNSDRFRKAAVDAPLAIDPFLRKVSATFRGLANEMPNQLALSPSEPPTLSIDSQDEVSLLTSDNDTVTITVTSTAGKEQPVWLTAQYNDDWLEVDQGVHHQQDLADAATKNPEDEASQYPLRANKLGLDKTGDVPAGKSREFPVKIKRREAANAGGVTKLIVKAASGDTFVRRELHVNLPGKKLLDITVNAPPGFWSADTRAIRPLPNREQSFSFDVVNVAKVARKLDVAFVAPSTMPPNSDYSRLPISAQKPEAAKERLEAYGPLVPLGPSMPVELPASDKPVRIKLAPSEPPADPKANLLQAKPEPKSPGIALPYGLMILITDRDTKEVTIRPIEIKPLRPTGYVKAKGNYNLQTKKLEIEVSAKNTDVIPPDGLQISADVTNVSNQRPRSLEGRLKAPNFTTTLYAHIASNEETIVNVGVNVDDYPRAFVFQFPGNRAQPNLTPAVGLKEVRIVSPLPGTAFKAPVDPKSLEIIAEVDAPTRSFGDSDSKSHVSFGIDENQDGELQGDEVETRWADRQVSVAAKSLSPDGSLVLDTRVSDFHLGLSSGLADHLVYVTGQITTDGETKSCKQPVEILLDGSPPKIYAEFPTPSREVEIDSDFLVRVITHENELDLSGVQKVEATFETAATKASKNGMPAKWEEGEPDKEKENAWTVKLSAKGIGLGQQTVLLRATDKVGNESMPIYEKVKVIPKRPKTEPAATKEPPKPDVNNVVTGKVKYGDEGVKAKVTLESLIGPQVPAVTSDAKGAFKFPKVPPGKYTLRATTKPEAIRNQYRTADMEITVEPKPKPETSVSVKLR